MYVADGALQKAALAIAQVEFPHPDKLIRVTESSNFMDAREKVTPPVIQGQGIVQTDILYSCDLHVTDLFDGRVHHGQAGQTTTRENVTLNKIDITLCVVPTKNLVHGDFLDFNGSGPLALLA